MKKRIYFICLIIIVSLIFNNDVFSFSFKNNNIDYKLTSVFQRLNKHLKKITKKVWIYKKYSEAKLHKATLDFDNLMDLGEEVLNKPLRQSFNRNIYSSLLIDDKLIVEMTDQELIEAIKYEFNNWCYHMDYELNPPKYWHIIIDARPYLNDINDKSCIVFYLLNHLYCDTKPCSICGDGCRYWALKNEALKRNLVIILKRIESFEPKQGKICIFL